MPIPNHLEQPFSPDACLWPEKDHRKHCEIRLSTPWSLNSKPSDSDGNALIHWVILSLIDYQLLGNQLDCWGDAKNKLRANGDFFEMHLCFIFHEKI